MMQHPETMQVIYLSAPDLGPVDINTADFDETLHKALTAEAEGAPAKKAKRGRPAKSDTAEK